MEVYLQVLLKAEFMNQYNLTTKGFYQLYSGTRLETCAAKGLHFQMHQIPNLNCWS